MNFTLSTPDSDLRSRFFALTKFEEIADLLDVTYKDLKYYLYIVPNDQKYRTYSIAKKGRGSRIISSPTNALKIIQQKLSYILRYVYKPKPSAHGFVVGKSILSNAKMHVGKKFVFNTDLEDFFTSINFGRVRGMFIAKPYNLAPSAATVLAQIVCYDNRLPQGAPTSPIISNMICSKMDSDLLRLAKKNRCIYTRYADDITFSTSLPVFPSSIAVINQNVSKQVDAGHELGLIINSNGFKVNTNKVRLQINTQRQEVTGLTVNRFPNVSQLYIRNVRAMINAWDIYGLIDAENDFISSHDRKNRAPFRVMSFKHTLRGKIDFLGMIRGKNDNHYMHFKSQFDSLERWGKKDYYKQMQLPIPVISIAEPYVITEGKTDWKHIKAAFIRLKNVGEYPLFDLKFREEDDDNKKGSKELLIMCRQWAKNHNSKTNLFVFDRDEPDIIKDVTEGDKPFKNWGNNVYSIAIPIPDHRSALTEVSIELYYKDEDIVRKDNLGRRIYLNTEFSNTSGRSINGESFICTDHKKVRRNGVCVIDNLVYDRDDKNVAMTKNGFADNIYNMLEGFENIDISAFNMIFDIINTIILNGNTAVDDDNY